jgi:hypothetical protein
LEHSVKLLCNNNLGGLFGRLANPTPFVAVHSQRR